MKYLLPALGLAASVALARGTAAVGLVEGTAPHRSIGLTGQLRCVKAETSVDGVSDEQALLFEEIGFICQPE
jgi:hypothetical protein